MSSEPGAELLDTTQAGARAGVSSRTIYKWKAAGHIAFVGALVDRASLDAYIRERNAARRQKAIHDLIETSEPGAELGAELMAAPASALVAELGAEVRTLRQQVEALALLQTLYGPHEPGPPVVLRREEYPSEDTPAPDPAIIAPGGFWARLRAWWEGGR